MPCGTDAMPPPRREQLKDEAELERLRQAGEAARDYIRSPAPTIGITECPVRVAQITKALNDLAHCELQSSIGANPKSSAWPPLETQRPIPLRGGGGGARGPLSAEPAAGEIHSNGLGKDIFSQESPPHKVVEPPQHTVVEPPPHTVVEPPQHTVVEPPQHTVVEPVAQPASQGGDEVAPELAPEPLHDAVEAAREDVEAATEFEQPLPMASPSVGPCSTEAADPLERPIPTCLSPLHPIREAADSSENGDAATAEGLSVDEWGQPLSSAEKYRQIRERFVQSRERFIKSKQQVALGNTDAPENREAPDAPAGGGGDKAQES